MFKGLFGLPRQSPSVQMASERKIQFSTIEIQEANPVQVTFFLKEFQCRAESIERLTKTPQLHERHTVEGCCFGPLIRQIEIPKIGARPPSQY